MNFDWYKIFNKTAWQSENLVSRTILLDLEGRGRTQFLLTEGNTTALQFDDEFFPVNFLDQNPYAKGGYAVYIDGNDDVWFGFETEDEE